MLAAAKRAPMQPATLPIEAPDEPASPVGANAAPARQARSPASWASHAALVLCRPWASALPCQPPQHVAPWVLWLSFAGAAQQWRRWSDSRISCRSRGMRKCTLVSGRWVLLACLGSKSV